MVWLLDEVAQGDEDELRGNASGGPYTLIATVTPRTTTTYSDVVVGLGTRYYVVQSYYGSWTSVNSNEDSA